MIRLERVRAARAGRLVLDDVSLAVAAGELCAVLGARASGKTALADVAACLRAPDAGSVTLAGRDVLALQGASLPFVRRNIGYLAQAAPLLGDETALDNVLSALGPRGVPLAEASSLAAAALAELGLEAAAGRLARALSAGERRLVALARALVGPPSLVVLDDPGAGLDAEDVGRVAGALVAARAAGAAILCLSADEAFVAALAARGARRAKLEGGRLLGGAAPMLVVEGGAGAGVGAGAGTAAGRAPAAPRPAPEAEVEPRRL